MSDNMNTKIIFGQVTYSLEDEAYYASRCKKLIMLDNDVEINDVYPCMLDDGHEGECYPL